MRNRKEIKGGSLIEVGLGKSVHPQFANSLRQAVLIHSHRAHRHKCFKNVCQLTLVLDGIGKTPNPKDAEEGLNGILQIYFLAESAQAKRGCQKTLRLVAYVAAATAILLAALCLVSTRVSNFLSDEYHSGIAAFHKTAEQVSAATRDRD